MFFHRRRHRRGLEHPHRGAGISLAEVPPGCEATLINYTETDAGMGGALRAYGLLPGRRVKVIAQHPVTIVQVEQTELALESQLARAIWVRVCPFDLERAAEDGDQAGASSRFSSWVRRAGRHRR